MRDLIWTLILVWVIYRIVTAFRIGPAKPNAPGADRRNDASGPTEPSDDAKRSALRKRLNEEGEYVDFEEIK